MISWYRRQGDTSDGGRRGRNHPISKASNHLLRNKPIIAPSLWARNFVLAGHHMLMPPVPQILDKGTVQLHVFELLVPISQGGNGSTIMRGGIERDVAKRLETLALATLQKIDDPGFHDQATHAMADQEHILVLAKLRAIRAVPHGPKALDPGSSLTQRFLCNDTNQIIPPARPDMRGILPDEHPEVLQCWIGGEYCQKRLPVVLGIMCANAMKQGNDFSVSRPYPRFRTFHATCTPLRSPVGELLVPTNCVVSCIIALPKPSDKRYDAYSPLRSRRSRWNAC